MPKKLKDIIKRNPEPARPANVDPGQLGQYSATNQVTESALLDKYLLAKGMNPKYIPMATKVSHSKSAAFRSWAQQQHEEVEVVTMETRVAEKKREWAEMSNIIRDTFDESRCWTGYKPVPGKVPYSKGSCAPVKKEGSQTVQLTPEETGVDESNVEAHGKLNYSAKTVDMLRGRVKVGKKDDLGPNSDFKPSKVKYTNETMIHQTTTDSGKTGERKSEFTKAQQSHKEIKTPRRPGSQNEAFKMPPETAAEKMQRLHQKIRKEKGLPDPDHYLKLAKQKQKEIDDLKKEETEIEESSKYAKMFDKGIKKRDLEKLPKKPKDEYERKVEKYLKKKYAKEEVEQIDENFKPGDFVKDIVHGHIHRVHKVEGNNLVVNRHHGKDSYGTFTNIHKTKARKVETPTNEEVTSSTDKLKVDYSKVKGQSSNPSPSKLSSLPYEKLKKQGVTENFDKYAHDPEMHFVVRHQDKLSKDAESPKKMWTAISKHNSIGHAQDAHAKLKSDNPGENYTYTMHRRGLHEDNFADNKAPTQTVLSGAELSEKKAKSFKKLKEDLFDHEKEDKSVKTYGKKPKFDKADKKDSEGEKKPQAAATLTGGSTMTGEKRDVVEIDPMMRNRPGQPDVTKKDDKKDKKDDKTKEKK